MPKLHLTPMTIQSIKKDCTRQEFADTDVPGLYLIVQPSGKKGWAARYRFNGKSHKKTLGAYPTVPLKAARDKMREIAALLIEGKDPSPATEDLVEDFRFETIFEKFMTRYVAEKNSPATDRARRSMYNTCVFPEWKGRDVREIKRRHVADLLDTIMDRGTHVTANRVLSMLKTFFYWCVDRGIIDTTPIARLQKPASEETRERYLADDELRLVWQAAERVGYPYGTVTKALILCGQRKMEVGAALRSEFERDDDQRIVWVIPKTRTKNKKEMVVPLTPLLLATFDSAPKIGENSNVFFTTDGTKPVNSYGDGKALIDGAMLAIQREEAVARGENPADVEAIDHWTFHDLRRTMTTRMAQLKVEPHVAEAMLNHISGTISGVALVYNRYRYYPEKREAMLKWEAYVRRVCLGESNVVYLPLVAAE